MKLQLPNVVPCFLHNLSNYDAHFIVRELDYDTKSISVIPNTEEKYISFSKYISNTFTIRFIDTFRFMASRLSTLASNLITPGFEKFRETSKMFAPEDMSLVTHAERRIPLRIIGVARGAAGYATAYPKFSRKKLIIAKTLV